MKKMLPWLITILLSITLIVVAVFLLSDKMQGNNNNNNNNAAAAQIPAPEYHMTADQIVEVTSEIKDITTNMADPDYVIKMSLAFQLSDKKAKEEFDKIKDFKIKPIIIKTLMDTKPESLKDSKGVEQFTQKLQDQINKSLTQGRLVKVEITDKIISGL